MTFSHPSTYKSISKLWNYLFDLVKSSVITTPAWDILQNPSGLSTDSLKFPIENYVFETVEEMNKH